MGAFWQHSGYFWPQMPSKRPYRQILKKCSL